MGRQVLLITMKDGIPRIEAL